MKLARMDMKLEPSEKAKIRRGAKKARQSMNAFVLAAALEKVDAVLQLGSYAK